MLFLCVQLIKDATKSLDFVDFNKDSHTLYNNLVSLFAIYILQKLEESRKRLNSMQWNDFVPFSCSSIQLF